MELIISANVVMIEGHKHLPCDLEVKEENEKSK